MFSGPNRLPTPEQVGEIMKLANLKRRHSSVLYNEGYAQACSHPVIVAGAGASVYDAEGQEYLDTANGAGSILLGHAHPKVVTAVPEFAK